MWPNEPDPEPQPWYDVNWLVGTAGKSFLRLHTMVRLQDGSLSYDVWNDLGNLICLKHLFTSTAVTNVEYIKKKSLSLHTCGSELPSDISIMVHTLSHTKHLLEFSYSQGCNRRFYWGGGQEGGCIVVLLKKNPLEVYCI